MSIQRLSLGTVQFGASYGVANQAGLPGVEAVDAILSLALDVGIQSLDTAAAYGLSEERIGSFVRRRGCADAFEFCTKLPVLGEGLTGSALSSVVSRAVESSLRKLSVPYVDEYLVHDSADLRRYGPVLIEALLAQRDRGRVQRVGVSVYGPDELTFLDDYPELDVLQHPLSLLDQRLLADEQLESLHAAGISVHARSVFLQGLLAIPVDSLPTRVSHANEELGRLHDILRDWNLTPMEASLQFVSEAHVDKIVIGVDSPAHLQANLDALERPIPAELFEQLTAAFHEVPTEILDPRTWPEETG